MNATRDRLDLGPFEFERGGSIPELTVAYESYGDPTNDAVLACHALTGSANVAGPADDTTAGQAAAWWDDVVGPGRAIDTDEYFVVCANVPGSCYGTSGPPTPGPDGEPWGPDFPAVTVGDWTRAQRRLLDALGVDRLRAVVGGSVGGMNVLDWARRYPDDVDLVIPVATAARLDAQCLALDAVARRAIASDPNWNGGRYYGVSEGNSDGSSDAADGGPGPVAGLALARQLGHVMYLSKASMARKFGRRAAGREAPGASLAPADPAADAFSYRDVESYLDYRAATFAERFDANSYLYLTRAMDAFDLAAGHDSAADALAGFAGDALVLSFTGDWHFTVEQAADLARAFRRAGVPTVHHTVESDHGHDAFLVEPDAVGPPIEAALKRGVAALDRERGRGRVERRPHPVGSDLGCE